MTQSAEKKLVLATGNEGKKREIENLLKHLNLEVLSLQDLNNVPLIDEDRPTLEGNAEKKARVIYELSNLPTLADDTGLEVEALGGRPGVRSARYAGERANADANRALLLDEMDGQTQRNARFRTVLAFIADGKMIQFEGICEGQIIESQRGTGGFGYDSIFVPKGSTLTFAEMPIGEKNKLSHRGQALQKFVKYLTHKE